MVNDAQADVRVSVADVFNARTDEVALAESDSAAFNKVFWSFVFSGWLRNGDAVVVDRLSYDSHQFAIMQAATFVGLEVVVADSPSDWPSNTRLVHATWIGTHCGHVRDLSGPAEEAGRRDVPFLVDGCQAFGHLPIDVKAMGCTALTGTGRKWMRGPRGTAALYVDSAWLDRMTPIFLDGDSAEWEAPDRFEFAPGARRFERFETSIAAVLGLGVAIEQLLALGIDQVSARILELGEYLRGALTDLGCTVHDGDGQRCGIVTFTVPGVLPSVVADAAGAAGININNSLAHSARIDMDARGLDRVVRASPHVYNTTEELDALVDVVRDLRS